MTKHNPKSDEVMTPSCAHHWKVDPPKDGVSRGICSRCGARREFSDSPTASSQPRVSR